MSTIWLLFGLWALGSAGMPDEIRCGFAGGGWAKQDLPCGPGLTFVSAEHKRGMILKKCCDFNHPNFNMTVEQAKACRTTDCVPKYYTSDLCTTLGPMYVYGLQEPLQSDQLLMRESCLAIGNKAPGEVGMCCVKNSKEGQLLTTMGAEASEFPHQAKLRLPENCGGTIYNDEYVITAAHCIIDTKTRTRRPINQMNVKIGTNLGEVEGEDTLFKVVQAIPHPDYGQLPENEGKPQFGNFIHDIALLRLNKKIKFGPNVKAMKIAKPGFQPIKYAERAAMIGWGKSDLLVGSQFLMKANFLLRHDDECYTPGRKYDDLTQFQKYMLCTGGIVDNKWSYITGQGSSGGPAICRNSNGKAVLCGVASFGGSNELCAKFQDEANCAPSIYTRVSEYYDWIRGEAGKQEETVSPNDIYEPDIYGKPVSGLKYPHQIHITTQDGQACGGTLIKKNVALTAAHCVLTPTGSQRPGVKIVAGINDLKGQGQEFGLARPPSFVGGFRTAFQAKQINHGIRRNMKDDYYKNDLALIQLDGEAPVQESQLPGLPSRQDEDPATGLELAFPSDEYTEFGTTLRERDFRFINNTECNERMERLAAMGLKAQIGKDMLCGVETYTGGSMCDRELGGGMICKGRDGKEKLCGVQVFRLCESTIPNGFINMKYYGDSWVKPVMEEMK